MEANRYTSLENLVWSHTVFYHFSFCRKRRFMKPLLMFSSAYSPNLPISIGLLLLTNAWL